MDTSEGTGNENITSIDTIISRIENEIMQYSDPLSFIIPSRLPKKDLDSIAESIEKDLKSYIIENVNVDKEDDEILDLEIERLGMYKGRYNIDKISKGYYALKENMPNSLPEGRKIISNLDKTHQYILNLEEKIKTSHRIVNAGIKLKESIDECLHRSKIFTTGAYGFLNEWASGVDRNRKSLFLEGKDYKISKEEFMSRLQDKTITEIFNEKIDEQKNEIYDLYKKRLNEKAKEFGYGYIFDEIEKYKSCKGIRIELKEMKQLFNNYYKNFITDENSKSSIESELSEDKLEEYVNTETDNYRKKFSAFFQGMLSYNVETKKKDDLLSSFNSLHTGYLDKLKNNIIQYKDELKNNEIYSHLEDYMAEYGITDWMAVMENIK